MSENKNIVIQQNNRTDYDKLHPEVYDKNVNLSTENTSVWGNTLQDALPRINERVSKTENNQWGIGDLRHTLKTTLNEEWLKADGGFFEMQDYPELSKMTEFKGYPYGVKEIIKEEQKVPRIKQGIGFNETNLLYSPAIFVNGYYIRIKKEFNQNGSHKLYIYYSQDLESWKSFTINFTISSYTSSYTVRILGGGYENGYWYFSFVFYSGYQEADKYLLYSSEFGSENWGLIQIVNPLSISYKAVAWSGNLVFQDGKWRTYLGLNTIDSPDSSGANYIAALVSENIDFQSSYCEAFSETLSSGYNFPYAFSFIYSWKMGNNVFLCASRNKKQANNGIYYCLSTIGSTNTTLRAYNNQYSFGEQVVKINENLIYFGINFSTSSSTSFLNLKVDSDSFTISQGSSNKAKVNYIQEGRYYAYYVLKNNLTIVYGEGLTPDDISIVDSYSGTISAENNFYGNVRKENGMYYYSSDSEDGSTIYRIPFANILPSYSITGFNTFIKALD